MASLLGLAPAAGAQVGQPPLSFDAARVAARRVSPELRAAREAVAAAEALDAESRTESWMRGSRGRPPAFGFFKKVSVVVYAT